jgi:hypothetical protein
MTLTDLSVAAERLKFLHKVVKREVKHLQTTDARLFAEPLTLELLQQLEVDEELAERVEAFISRFGRLQDTLSDKLLPQLLVFLGEKTGVAIDNFDRAESLDWITSTATWMEMRKLRNQMVREYIDDLTILVDALNLGHERSSELVYAANRKLIEVESRIQQMRSVLNPT